MYMVLYQRQNNPIWLVHGCYDTKNEAKEGVAYLNKLHVKDTRIIRLATDD